MQSTRFGFRSSSSTASETASTSAKGVPGAASLSRTMIPSCSSESSSSRSERIIPFDSTPRSFAFFSFVPSGITAPGSATATVCPAATFGAPQTIVRVPSPSSTSQTLSRSASGCLPAETTWPTTKPSLDWTPTRLTRSTSTARIESSSATSSGSSPGSQ